MALSKNQKIALALGCLGFVTIIVVVVIFETKKDTDTTKKDTDTTKKDTDTTKKDTDTTKKDTSTTKVGTGGILIENSGYAKVTSGDKVGKYISWTGVNYLTNERYTVRYVADKKDTKLTIVTDKDNNHKYIKTSSNMNDQNVVRYLGWSSDWTDTTENGATRLLATWTPGKPAYDVEVTTDGYITLKKEGITYQLSWSGVPCSESGRERECAIWHSSNKDTPIQIVE
jgi:hypothetical protein